MKALIEYISFKKNSFCSEKLSYLISGTINIIVYSYTDDKIVAVLVSFLSVEKTQYKYNLKVCVCFVLNVFLHFLKRQFSS